MLGKFINHCEDSLTAAIFTHLLHLPTEVFWQILASACYTEHLPKFTGEIEICELWPKWNAMGTGNSHYVEPDVFIRFRDFDLIIEAKRWDADMQYTDQWRRELVSYLNVYGEDRKPVRIVAIGTGSIRDEQLFHPTQPAVAVTSTLSEHPDVIICPVHMCKWAGLLHGCKRYHHDLDRQHYPSSQTHATKRLLGDLIELFRWHGFATGRWFTDFDFYKNRLSPSTQLHQSLLQSRSQQLRHL